MRTLCHEVLDNVFDTAHVKYVHGGDAAINETVGAEIAKELDRQVQADMVIFEHKRHVAEPVLCDGDVPIPVFRRYAQQFYA